MQSILTTNEIREFHQKGLKQIFVDQMPVLTDLAREELNRYGMEIIINSGRKTESKTETFTLSGGKVPFRQLICSDKKLIGTFIGTPHPVMTEFVGHLGFDFVTIDAEHNAMHLETVQKMLQSLKASSTYGMVRVPVLSYEAVSGALDIGADALLIPQIRTMEDINKLKQFSQYPPIGRRGAGPSRLWDYGDSIGNLAGEDPNYTTNIIVQLETVQAVENIDQIVESDFIDMFFIGPGDLSMDMGIFGQFGHPKLVETIMLLREKTKKAGKRLGIFAGNFEAAKSWYEKGFDMTIINSELAIMGTAISQNMTQLREAIGEPL